MSGRYLCSPSCGSPVTATIRQSANSMNSNSKENHLIGYAGHLSAVSTLPKERMCVPK